MKTVSKKLRSVVTWMERKWVLMFCVTLVVASNIMLHKPMLAGEPGPPGWWAVMLVHTFITLAVSLAVVITAWVCKELDREARC